MRGGIINVVERGVVYWWKEEVSRDSGLMIERIVAIKNKEMCLIYGGCLSFSLPGWYNKSLHAFCLIFLVWRIVAHEGEPFFKESGLS